jgi:hypothetical protein
VGRDVSNTVVIELRIGASETTTNTVYASEGPEPPAIAVGMPAPVPIQRFWNSVAPITMGGQTQPQIPVLQTGTHRFIEPPDLNKDLTTYQRRERDGVTIQKDPGLFEARSRKVGLLTKGHGLPLAHGPLRMALQTPEHLLQRRRLQQIVGIQEEKVGSSSEVCCTITSGGRAASLRLIDHSNPGREVAQLLQQSQGFRDIGAIIDDDPLPLLKGLLKERAARLFKDGTGVEEGCDDSHGRRCNLTDRSVGKADSPRSARQRRWKSEIHQR